MVPGRERFHIWFPGLALALIGVVGVRLVAPMLTGRAQAIVSVIAYLLVPLGLGLIARRIHRRAVARSAGPR